MQALHTTPAKSAQHRFATIGFVGALHIAFIYAVLVTLGYVPPPIHQSTPIVRIIDQTASKPTDNLPQRQTPMAKPDRPDVPKPVIDIGPNPDGGANTLPPGGTGTSPVTFEPVTALAGTHTIPAYPPLDRRLDHEGKVRLKLTIDAQGAVSDATVEKSSGYDGLDSAAVAWVKAHWRYKPATQNGTPVPATTSADVVFRLTQG